MSGFFSLRKGFLLLASIALLGVIGVGTLRRASGNPQTKIEYWVVEIDVTGNERASRAIQEKLSQLGESGWQLAEIREGAGQATVYWLIMSREER